MERYSAYYEMMRGIAITCSAAIVLWFDSTYTFLFALILGFLFNVIAGFRADQVKFQLVRLIPPIIKTTFEKNKFKDSLMELFLISSVTYVLKGIMDLLNYGRQSSYVVQFLLAVAIYFYFRNALRNLKTVYPRVKFITVLYFLMSFEFRKLVGDEIADEMDKAEKAEEKRMQEPTK